MKVLIGGIHQETNTFNPSLLTMERLRSQHYLLGEQLLGYRIRNEIGGFYNVADEEGIEYVPSLFVKSNATGVMAADDYVELKKLLVQYLEQALAQSGQQMDGIYFALHGAMAAQTCDDVEGEVIDIVRQVVGSHIPFVISLDSHANVTKRMVAGVDGIVGFKTYPHIDLFETGQAAAKLLLSIMRKELRPYMAMRKLPMIVPPENSQSMHGPFAELLAEAEAGVRNGESVLTSVFPTQPWLDIEELGFSVTVVAADKDKAEREAERLAGLIWDKRHAFDVDLYQVEQVVEIALRDKAEYKAAVPRGPYVIADSADSPGAGSSGDSNVVLRKMLALNVQDKLSCLIEIVDAPAVSQAMSAGIGSTVELQLGYSVNRMHGGPIAFRGEVIRFGDGEFTLKNGRKLSMGRSVVLRNGLLSVVVHELATYSQDPSMYRVMGLEPMSFDIVLVRAAMQFRVNYEAMARNIFILDTPGYSTPNLTSLPFHKIKRPFYPFDDHFDWRSYS